MTRKNLTLITSQVGTLFAFVAGIVIYVMTTNQEAAICFSIATAICGFITLQIYKTNQALRDHIDLQDYQHPIFAAVLLFIAFVFGFLGAQNQSKDLSPVLLSLQTALLPFICMMVDLSLDKLHYMNQFEKRSSFPILLAHLPMWIILYLLTSGLSWSEPIRISANMYWIASLLVEISYLFRSSPIRG